MGSGFAASGSRHVSVGPSRRRPVSGEHHGKQACQQASIPFVSNVARVTMQHQLPTMRSTRDSDNE